MQARTSLIATSLVALLALVQPPAAAAQRASLDNIDRMLARAEVADARAMLADWMKKHRPDAHSTYLSARLATRAEDAEDGYLSVALSYSTSPYAAESLLRLAQARIAAGDKRQARVYLQRLLADYPRTELRAEAKEWMARVSR